MLARCSAGEPACTSELEQRSQEMEPSTSKGERVSEELQGGVAEDDPEDEHLECEDRKLKGRRELEDN